MHLNARFSAHLMLRVGPRGSMQQCLPVRLGPVRGFHRRALLRAVSETVSTFGLPLLIFGVAPHRPDPGRPFAAGASAVTFK